MAFTRRFTDQDTQALTDAEAPLSARGIQVKNGERYAEENAQMIVGWFDKNPNVPITSDQIQAVANLFVSKLHYVSPLAAEFNNLFVTLSQDEGEDLQDFLRRYSLTQIEGSAGGFKNALLLVGWLKRYGYSVTIPNLATAMNGFAQSMDPKTQLSWIERVPTEPKRYGRHTEDNPDRKPGELFTDKDESRLYVNGRRNHSLDPDYQQKPTAPTLDKTEAAWKRMGLTVINNGRTHAQKAERQENFDEALAKTGSYRKAYEAAQRTAKEHEMRGY